MSLHPAPWSSELLPLLKILLAHTPRPILDPMAGIGLHGIPGVIHSELETEWVESCPRPAIRASALNLPFRDGSIGTVVTSPTYGNRMADHHDAQDGSYRMTYRHRLGRELTPNNTGAMQWGREYREAHRVIWSEVSRVLQPKGRLILNMKDHYRRGQIQRVTNFHYHTLVFDLNFQWMNSFRIPTPGNRYGANRDLRVDFEWIILLRKS